MATEILKRPAFHLIIIVILGLIVYSNTFNVPFQFDDKVLIYYNPLIRDIGNFVDMDKIDSTRLIEEFYTLRYIKTRYVGFLTLWANYRLHGLEVGGYHSLNLALHIVNAVLVYFLVILSFRTPLLSGSSLAGRSWLVGLFAGLFFVAHPLQTEGVTYILSRFVLLTAMFYMLALVLYIKARQSSMAAEGKERKSVTSMMLYCFAILCCLLAMKTKENAFTLPVAIALFEVVFFRGSVKRRAVYLVPFLMTMLIIPLTYIGFSTDAGGVASNLDVVTKLSGAPSRLDYLITQFNVIAKYLGLLFITAGQNVDHNPQIYQSFFNPQVFLSFLFLLSIICFGGYLLYRSRIADSGLRLIAFGIFWFFLALSVESSIFPISEIMVEYRTYLPSVGFHIAATTGIFILIGRIRNKNPAYVSLVLVLIVLATVTYARNTVWKSEITLWEDSVKKSPEKARTYVNLGGRYLFHYGIQNAIEQYQKALNFDPGNREANISMGRIYIDKGMPEEAIKHFKVAMKSDPDFPDTYIFLGKAYLKTGDVEEAELNFRKVLKWMPNNGDLRLFIGNDFVKEGYPDKALELFESVLEWNPDDALTHNNIGAVYQSKGMVDKAIEHYRTAAELEPRDPTSYYNLGIIYQSRNLIDNAIQLYQIALKVDPKYADAHNNLGVAYRSKGMADRAIEHYRAALELAPNYVQAHYNLGLVYLDQGLKAEARREFEEALRIDPDYVNARESLDRLDRKPQV